MLKLDGLTSLDDDDFAHYNYINVLYEKESKDINELNIEVDRGVTMFLLFGTMLTSGYPNLKRLTLRQNYSSGGDDTIESFYDLLKV
jgi:hypothetical protein